MLYIKQILNQNSENISNNKDFISYLDFPSILDSAYLEQKNSSLDVLPIGLDFSVAKGTATVGLQMLRFFLKSLYLAYWKINILAQNFPVVLTFCW